MNTIQDFADILKCQILESGYPTKRRLSALKTINKLEGCPWHEAAMTETLNSLNIDYDNGAFSFSSDAIDDLVLCIYERYREILGCDCEDNILDDVFDMQGAAKYLGISYDMMKHHVHRTHVIQGRKIGRKLLFSRAQLDKLK